VTVVLKRDRSADLDWGTEFAPSKRKTRHSKQRVSDVIVRVSDAFGADKDRSTFARYEWFQKGWLGSVHGCTKKWVTEVLRATDRTAWDFTYVL
jgi:hypothetical protein